MHKSISENTLNLHTEPAHQQKNKLGGSFYRQNRTMGDCKTVAWSDES